MKKKSFKLKSGKYKLLNILDKNPDIWLYHTTKIVNLKGILKEGLVRYSSSPEDDEIAKYDFEMALPIHSEAIFFFKEESDIFYDLEWIVLKIKANLIDCRCMEANMEISDELYDLFSTESGWDEEEEWELIAKYEETLRPLDKKENDYITEVMCKCDIPPELLSVYEGNDEDKKRLFEGLKKIYFSEK